MSLASDHNGIARCVAHLYNTAIFDCQQTGLGTSQVRTISQLRQFYAVKKAESIRVNMPANKT